jgi:hypothetical protein
MTECIDHGRRGNRDGYAQVKRVVGGVRRHFMLHRIVYCQHYGVSLDSIKGLVVRHACDNPRCINPDHLLIGTHQDNSNDKLTRGRQPKRESHGRAKLNEIAVRFIRSRYDPKSEEYNACALARMFGVSRTAIRKVVTGENWHETT